MTEFQEGDIVRVVKAELYDRNRLRPCLYAIEGETYNVNSLSGLGTDKNLSISGRTSSRFSGALGGYVAKENVELVRPAAAGFKLGDRVKVVEPKYRTENGRLDTSAVLKAGDVGIVRNFDADLGNLSISLGDGQGGLWWWILPEYVELAPPAAPISTEPAQPHQWGDVQEGDIVTVETALSSLLGRPDTVDNTAVITAPVARDREGNLRWRELDLTIHQTYPAYKILDLERPAKPRKLEERRKPVAFRLTRLIPQNGIFASTTIEATGLGVVEDGFLVTTSLGKNGRAKVTPGRDTLKLWNTADDRWVDYTITLGAAQRLTHEES